MKVKQNIKKYQKKDIYHQIIDSKSLMIYEYKEMINLLENIKTDKEIPKEKYTSPEKKSKLLII